VTVASDDVAVFEGLYVEPVLTWAAAEHSPATS